MKVIAFNGSARKDGNTAILLNTVLEEIKKEGIETELYQLAGKKIQGCIACYKCMKNKDKRCAVTKDIVNECIEKMIEADGILLGSPTYFADVSAGTRALIERTGYVARANDYMFKRKVGAGVIAVRQGRGDSRIQFAQPLPVLPADHQPGFQLLGLCHRARPRRGAQRRRGHADHEDPGGKPGLAAEEGSQLRAIAQMKKFFTRH